MRVASLILSSTPFAVLGIIILLMFTTDGWGSLGYLVMAIVAIPILLIMSIISVPLAFKKTPNLKFDAVSKAMSIVSVSLFGIGSILVAYGFIVAQLAYTKSMG